MLAAVVERKPAKSHGPHQATALFGRMAVRLASGGLRQAPRPHTRPSFPQPIAGTSENFTYVELIVGQLNDG